MLKMPEPSFGSSLTSLIIEFEGLRNKSVSGTTRPWIFFELKDLFHVVEALSSARIEGNHTTLAEFVESSVDNGTRHKGEEVNEIANIIEALNFIDSNIENFEINKSFILELHRVVVRGLDPGKEGDARSGAFRTEPRSISNSKLVLPQPSDINDLMGDLVNFIKETNEPKQDLLKTAIAHHRFTAIHPFGNGNGRVVRLLTYAMLCKQGFITPGLARLLNPAAVFYGDRQEYYRMLETADKGKDEDILAWCEYVLSGLKEEVEKSQRLSDHTFVRNYILLPTIEQGEKKNILSELEAKAMRRVAQKDVIKASDIRNLWPSDTSHVTVSKLLRKLREQRFIRPLKEGGREYILQFTGNKLTRGILEQMETQKMLPMKVDETASQKPRT